MTDKTEDEKLQALLKVIDEFEITPEMIDDAERVARDLGRMTLEDWFTEFTI
jgi:propanediol dehydratase small subunit